MFVRRLANEKRRKGQPRADKKTHSTHSIHERIVFGCRYTHCVSIIAFLPARRYAERGLCASDVSIRPSVKHRYCIKTKRDVMIFFTVGEPEHSSFFINLYEASFFGKYSANYEIRKGSPRARTIYETGVGSNWRFWRFFDL